MVGMIAVVDYGLGNLRSVAGAVKRVGFNPVITSDPAVLRSADKLILPGVGAFGDGMRSIRERGLDTILDELVLVEKKPVLGICLGFQLMARSSAEFGEHTGLGWIEADVVRMDVDFRLPHVGWNDLVQRRKSLLFDEIPDEALFYYVHSYHVKCTDPALVTGECGYGRMFTASIEKDNVFGTQFHPEKSQRWGLELMHNFLAKV